MDSFSDYDEQYDYAFDFAFLSKFFNKGTENNKTENKIDNDSLFGSNESASNTLNVVKHLEHDPKGEAPRWIRRRRFKKGTEEYIIWRREIRLKNRISARKSIEKKQVCANPPILKKTKNKVIFFYFYIFVKLKLFLYF